MITSNGVMLKRIIFTNHEDGVTYTYVTNDFTLPAYQIVPLYEPEEKKNNEAEQRRQSTGSPALAARS